jgi:ribosomal protein L34E
MPPILYSFENQKNELKGLIQEREREMKTLSRSVSRLQIEIIGLKGGLVATEKMIKQVKEENKQL